VVFSAANLENPAKGFPGFLALMERLKSHEIQVIVMGRSNSTVNLPVPFYNAGYIGDVSTVRALTSAADLYITTSQEDNLPTTVMESLACGIPALGYEIGGIPELISHGITGFVYPNGAWHLMADGVIKLIEEPPLLAEFSANARLKAEALYDEAKVSQQYAELYQSISLL
jgi:glycosyltransferase involved in cell wall biosynthesis